MPIDGRSSRPLGEVEYAELVARVRAMIARAVPPGASVLVVSKGDPALLDLPGLRASHFPQSADGQYAGHHPADADAATSHLEELRRRGAEYLVIPATALWWLEHYEGLAQHLSTHGALAVEEPDAGLIYALGGRLAQKDPGALAITRSNIAVAPMRDFLENLMPAEATVVVIEADGPVLGELPSQTLWKFPPDGMEPCDDDEPLLDELERLTEAGASYLVVPKTADEWLEERATLAGTIEGRCRMVANQGHLCRVFDLTGLREAAA